MEQLFFAFVACIIILIKNSKLAPPRRNFWIRLRFNSATEGGQWWRETGRSWNSMWLGGDDRNFQKWKQNSSFWSKHSNAFFWNWIIDPSSANLRKIILSYSVWGRGGGPIINAMVLFALTLADNNNIFALKSPKIFLPNIFCFIENTMAPAVPSKN